MDDFERAMREKFYAENGKTPEQEEEDSARMFVLVMVAVVLALVGLTVYLW